MIFAIIKLSLILFILYIAIFVIRHFKALAGISFYHKQGVTVFPGAKRFIVGNFADYAKYKKAAMKSDKPFKHLIGWLLD